MNAPAGRGERGRAWAAAQWARLRRRLGRLGRSIRRYARAGMRNWRHSLRLRVAATTVAVGTLALVLLAAVLSDQVRDGLFEQRRDQVLADAAARAEQAQKEFDSATVSTTQEVQQLAQDMVSRLQASSVDARGVLLLRSPNPSSPVLILAPATDNSLKTVISEGLREEVRDEQFQQWQSVALPTPEGGTEPGIVVGSPVTIPVAGDYELYVVYSLASEQAKLDLLQQVLAVGAASLVALLLVMAWYLTRQVLDPVQQAARTAERLADGHLTERMQVRGHDELATLGKSFNEMAASLQEQIEQLAELSRMQQRFVSDVSHELRTPLTTVRMAAEVLYEARESFPTSQARSTELLHTQLDRFENLLADLLEISRFDAGAAVLDVEPLDLRDLVDRVVGLTEPLAEERGGQILVIAGGQVRDPDADHGESDHGEAGDRAADIREVDNSEPGDGGMSSSEPGDGDVGTVDADARRVERILRNLLINAVEHGEGHDIEVHLAGHATAVSVVVRDHGIGMTAVQAQHVFDRFWRADPARARTLGGTGLGLAIALEDARLHGGTLDAWGQPGHGARFRLTLPRRSGMEIGQPPLPLRSSAEQAPSEPEIEAADPAAPAHVPHWNTTEEP